MGDLSQFAQLIAILVAAVKLDRRLSRIEKELNRCPHVEDKSPLVHRAADF